jgi:YegS/Rv2252/BmrU family lipid kinase
MRSLIIYNPAAGQWPFRDEVLHTAEFLTGRGWEVLAVKETHGPGDATTYAREAVAHRCDVVLVAAGDGTIAQAVDGLVGSETALAVLPAGTGNVFARQLNLPVPGGLYPKPILESARLLLEHQIRRVDVGRISPSKGRGFSRHFLCWGSIGFDAQLNVLVHAAAQRKKRLGWLAWVITTVLTLREFAGTAAVVRVDGQRVSRRVIMLTATNIQLWGIVFRMAQNAVMDDGLLDVYCFQGSSPLNTLMHIAKLLVNRHVQDPRVDVFRARQVQVSTYRPLLVHVDGDAIGYTPVVIDVVPRAMNLLVPSCAPASLFSDGTGMLAPETAWHWMARMARDAHSAFRQRSGLE